MQAMTSKVKRVHSLDDVDQSTASDPWFTQAKKKGRKKGPTMLSSSKLPNSQSSQSNNSDLEIEVDEEDANVLLCVICSESGSDSSTIQCETCDQYYHLSCCGVDDADHSTV